MTADESLQMAREAGLLGLDAEGRLERFRKLAYEAGVRAEREACAELVDGMDVQHPKYIAAAIRARRSA